MNNTTIPEIDISQIAGNAPDDMKLWLGNIPRFFNGSKRQHLDRFAKAIELRLKLTELSILSKADEPNKLEGKAVLEIDVAEGTVTKHCNPLSTTNPLHSLLDMVNLAGNIHGGCSAYLIDV